MARIKSVMENVDRGACLEAHLSLKSRRTGARTDTLVLEIITLTLKQVSHQTRLGHGFVHVGRRVPGNLYDSTVCLFTRGMHTPMHAYNPCNNCQCFNLKSIWNQTLSLMHVLI